MKEIKFSDAHDPNDFGCCQCGYFDLAPGQDMESIFHKITTQAQRERSRWIGAWMNSLFGLDAKQAVEAPRETARFLKSMGVRLEFHPDRDELWTICGKIASFKVWFENTQMYVTADYPGGFKIA